MIIIPVTIVTTMLIIIVIERFLPSCAQGVLAGGFYILLPGT